MLLQETLKRNICPMETGTMTLDGLVAVLSAHPGTAIRLLLPDDSFVPDHFHITEVGRVQKDFIDCGGAIRNSVTCVLQAWVANDVSHRLNTTRLSSIIEKGIPLLGSTDVPLEIEYDHGVISQYPVLGSDVTPQGVVLRLGSKHTACLAPDRCGISLDVLSDCSTPGCC
jgi:hypothetical protein